MTFVKKKEEKRMRFYQYGRIPESSLSKIKAELLEIDFIDENFEPADFPNALKQIFTKLFPSAKTQAALADAWHNIAVDEKRDLAELLETVGDSVSQKEFYNVALQLLGMNAEIDFSLADPIKFMKESKLPLIETQRIAENNILEAIYLLLQTRTKIGLTLIDYLAGQGFYENFLQSQPKHLFLNGKVQAIIDTKKLIRELVYIESPIDSAKTGKRDLLEVAIYRPYETELGMKVPVLFTADPYYKGIEDESKVVHNVNIDILPKEPLKQTLYDVTYQPEQTALPPKKTVSGEVEKGSTWNQDGTQYTMDNYFLARGFAQVYSAGVGTRGSDGLRMGAGEEETLGAVAVIEWLTGKRKAFAAKNSNQEVKAWWCNGKVAMTGISYLGTLSIAAATKGVDGLETIVSESGISSWYDYYRDHGLVVAPMDCQGEDIDVLAQFTYSKQENGAELCRSKIAWEKERAKLIAGQDRLTGDYSSFWDERNYRNHTDKIKCDIIFVRGLNDWNVKPRNAEKIWSQLRNRQDISTRIFLHQGQHQHMHNWRSIDFLDMMNLWFSAKLLDCDNGAQKQLPRVLIQDNTEPEKWYTQEDWAAPTNEKIIYALQGDQLIERNAIPEDQQPPAGNNNEPGPKELAATVKGGPEKTFIDDGVGQFLKGNQDVSQWEQELLQERSAYGRNRVIFKTEPLADDFYIDGTIVVSLDVAVDQPVGKLSVQIVDYGECRRLTPIAPEILWLGHFRPLGFDYRWDNLQEFILEAKSSPFKMITKGHINLANRRNAFNHEIVEPNEFYRVKWELQPTHWHILKGHRIGLVVYSTDMGMTLRGSRVENYRLRLDGCTVTIPTINKK